MNTSYQSQIHSEEDDEDSINVINDEAISEEEYLDFVQDNNEDWILFYIICYLNVLYNIDNM